MSEQEKSINIGDYDESMRIGSFMDQGMHWIDLQTRPELIWGFPWFRQDPVFRRLPRQPAYPIPGSVDHLANCTSGGQIRLITDSRKLAIRVRLHHPADMYHMPSTGQCGFDCYLETASGLKYWGTTRYDFTLAAYEYEFFAMESAGERKVILNFPLYQGVREVCIGVDEHASTLRPFPFARSRKIVFYGTSITQGGCASRPGMCYTNIISRKLDMECVNLGFSGSGRGEPELARLIGDIADVGCIVLDYEANSDGMLDRTLEPFIRIVREAHQPIPILVVSRIRYANENFSEQKTNERLTRLAYQRNLVRRLREEGDARIHFYDGSQLLGEDFDECTVDGDHPTDLGFYRMAEKLSKAISDIL